MTGPDPFLPDFVVLERLNPDPPIGILLDTLVTALKLLNWAATTPEYTCTVSDQSLVPGQPDSFTVQIEGLTTATAKATQGQVIVKDGNKFLALDVADFAAIYKPAGS